MSDGRNERVVRTKAAVLAACRDAMKAGIFRPPVTAVAKAARVSVRSVFEHFAGVEGLWREAIADPATNNAILDAICPKAFFTTIGEANAVVNAAVFGRVIDP
jgi:AcrR family transcriptional regulator